MESEQKRGRGGWAIWMALLLVTVFVVYPLSQGPALGVIAATESPALEVFNLVYLPLNCVLSVMPARARDPYLQYVVWWLPPEMRPPEPSTSGSDHPVP